MFIVSGNGARSTRSTATATAAEALRVVRELRVEGFSNIRIVDSGHCTYSVEDLVAQIEASRLRDLADVVPPAVRSRNGNAFSEHRPRNQRRDAGG